MKMTLRQSFLYAHREGMAFLIACPLLALIPVLAEFAQHVIEMQLGMYNGIDGAKAADGDPLRMQFGFVKVLALLFMGYPIIRFLAGGRDKAAAYQLEPRALALFAVPLTIQLAITAFDLFSPQVSTTYSMVSFVVMMLVTPFLLRWMTAAPLGIWISPARSAREMWPAWLWALAFGIVAMLPLMLIHYALGLGAIFAPDWAKWPMLVIDSFIVAWLSATMVASEWVSANRPGPLAATQAVFTKA